jgi:hypothetical protein
LYFVQDFGTFAWSAAAHAPAWLARLSTWLEPFEDCFGHVAQRGAFRRYLVGLLSDSRRKSMSAMLARVEETIEKLKAEKPARAAEPRKRSAEDMMTETIVNNSDPTVPSRVPSVARRPWPAHPCRAPMTNTSV